MILWTLHKRASVRLVWRLNDTHRYTRQNAGNYLQHAVCRLRYEPIEPLWIQLAL